MNANRKADLQRKLAVAPVPKPPAGLAERIKTEIPKELQFDVNRERDQFSHSLRVSLAVAASVIVVISSAFLAVHVMETTDQQPAAAKIAVPPPVALPPSAAPPAAAPLVVNQPAKPRLTVARKKERKRQAPAVANETRALDAASSNVVAEPPAAPAAVGGVAAAKTAQAVPFRDLSREEKIRILKDRLAKGADPKEIVKEARDAGLNDFADELEKKKP
ncbi:MAG TPA: hypothetical protein VJ853_04265 [Thermoanaerobaculia bacterium]|nr:hypothetical protein [Thermoanaerobaculia bacterium]